MDKFSVWAPRAGSVDLVVGRRHGGYDAVPMRAGVGGWWTCSPAGIHMSGEVDYGFSLDGGPARPDPRSRRQPAGVHELSRTFDPAAYTWCDDGWTGRQVAGAVIYELHLGTFTPEGTLDSAIDKLDHLVDLGIGLVELLPVGAFNGPHNWGYDGVLWYAVHEPYGGPAAYQRFVDACHARGLGVIQDVVYNHLGPSGNYLPEFGPYLRNDAANTWGAVVNLDGPGSDEVRRYIRENARMWFMDYHVDALRLDAVHALVDTRAVTVLEQLAIDADTLSTQLRRPLDLIAESDLNDPTLVTPRAAGGIGLTAAWDDDVHHAIHVAVTGETSGYYEDFAPLSTLAKALTEGYVHDGSYSTFRGRHHGKPIDRATTPAWRLVACAQDHDQVGNRAAGDRMNQQAGLAAQRIAAVLLLTAPFTPMLFMGEEWAASTPWQFFTSHGEPELAERTRSGRLAEFARHDWDVSLVPDPQDPATFARSHLDWDELAAEPHASTLALYRRLLRLRREHPAVSSPDWASIGVEYNEAEHWIRVTRTDRAADETIVVLVNLADRTQRIALPGDAGAGMVLLATAATTIDHAKDAVTVPGRSAAIVG